MIDLSLLLRIYSYSVCAFIKGKADNASKFRQIGVINTAGWAPLSPEGLKVNYIWSGLNVFQLAVRAQLCSQAATQFGDIKVFRERRTDSVSTHHYALCNWPSGWTSAYFLGNQVLLKILKIVKLFNKDMRNMASLSAT